MTWVSERHLVSAISNGGGFGVIASGSMSPDLLSTEIAETRKLHDSCRESDGRPVYPGEIGDGAAIAVSANVAGATVRIGGLRYGGTPVAPRLIKPGMLQVDIEKAGWKPAHVTIEALPAVVTDIAVELERVAP